MIKTKHTYTKLDASLSFRVGVTAAPVGPKLDRPGLVYEATKEYAEADREIMLLIMVDLRLWSSPCQGITGTPCQLPALGVPGKCSV